MKKIFYFILAILAVSCSDTTTDDVSRVTNYPVLTLNGNAEIMVPYGSQFTDPGIVAKEGEEVITYTSTIKGKYRGKTTVDTSIIDEYIVTYTAVNKDGFPASINRKFIVNKPGDLVNSIEGVYISTVKRNGALLNPAQGSSENMKYVYIWKNTDGTFGVSDAFGGWYDIGRNIGINSATLGGTITGNIATNTFTFPGNPLSNNQFGGSANITGLTVNATTKTVVLSCAWVTADTPPTNYNFVSTLTQVQL